MSITPVTRTAPGRRWVHVCSYYTHVCYVSVTHVPITHVLHCTVYYMCVLHVLSSCRWVETVWRPVVKVVHTAVSVLLF